MCYCRLGGPYRAEDPEGGLPTIFLSNPTNQCPDPTDMLTKHQSHSHFGFFSDSNPSPSDRNPIFPVQKQANPNSHCTPSVSSIGKNCGRGLENAALGRRLRVAFSSPRSQFFTIRTDPKPDNNMFILFSCGKLAYKWVSCLRNFVIELA